MQFTRAVIQMVYWNVHYLAEPSPYDDARSVGIGSLVNREPASGGSSTPSEAETIGHYAEVADAIVAQSSILTSTHDNLEAGVSTKSPYENLDPASIVSVPAVPSVYAGLSAVQSAPATTGTVIVVKMAAPVRPPPRASSTDS